MSSKDKSFKNSSNFANNDTNCCTASRSGNSGSDLQNRVQPSKSVELPHNSLTNMILIPEGNFLMGNESDLGFPQDGEGPVRKVELDPFYIDESAVTNAEFFHFVNTTGYRTEAETYGWSFVFHSLVPDHLIDLSLQSPVGTPWWKKVDGAYWQNPQGPGTDIKNIMDHPVVHISWNDASEYCSWTGKRLPTEAEWEYAARGKLTQNTYPWGNELTPNNVHMCNIWQGEFPSKNSQEDGYTGTAPAKAFYPNAYGIYNMVGNVWEWQSDWFDTTFPTEPILVNPIGPTEGNLKTIKGGSYLCHESYCNRYRVAARSSNTPDSSTGNLGFRCVKDTS